MAEIGLIPPKSVSIFAQPPGGGFVAFMLVQVSFPSADRVRLDLAETEDYERRWTVPRNPVERLTMQNKIREPDTLVVTGMLSANPLFSLVGAAGLARLDKKALALLRKLFDLTPMCFIVTPERPYQNMVCVSMAERYDETTGQGVRLTLTFQETLIAIPGLVDGVLDLETLALGMGSPTDLGPQVPADVADPGGLG